MQKVCENCQETFSCEQAFGCWCGTVKLSPLKLAWIKQQFQNCLCPKCLAALAAVALCNEKTT